MPALLSPSLAGAVVKRDHEPLAMKQCPRCKQLLFVDQFYKNLSKKDGLQSQCKSCQNYLTKQSAQKNPIIVQTCRMIGEARRRTKDKNVPFDIDADYLRSIIPSHCPIFGTPLEWSTHRGLGCCALPNSPSLDRIDPAKGYVKGNVWIISHRANTIKNDATHEELKLVTEAVGRAIVGSLDW